MKRAKKARRRSACPINVSLEIFGDRWSLLIVRDLMFLGRKSFHEFLSGEEGIATNILADRLKMLEANGILEKRRDPTDARKVNYVLTEKGFDLAPALIAMVIWAASHEKTVAPPAVVREMIGDRNGFLKRLRRQWRAAAT